MDQSRLARIGTILEEEVLRGGIAGGSVLIWRHGREQYYAQAGSADREAGAPVTRDTIFRLYSMTKPVTAAACMLLVERGELDLQAPVSQFLPAFRNQTVATPEGKAPVRREMTIQDLLGMTSGMPYSGDGPAGREAEEVWRLVARRQAEGKDLTTLEIAALLGQCSLQFQPGESWMYGASADIVGAVIEVVSGKPFDKFLREEMFEPLGMGDTDFFVPDSKRNRLAAVYRSTDQGLRRYTGNHLGILNAMDRPNPFASGGAGLVSTLDDYMKFARMLLCGGILDGVRILAPRTVASLTAPQLSPEQRRGMESWYGLGGYSYGRFMRVLAAPGEALLLGSPGEYGWDGWLGAYFANMPQEDATFLLMYQLTDSGTTELTRKLRNVMMAAME